MKMMPLKRMRRRQAVTLNCRRQGRVSLRSCLGRRSQVSLPWLLLKKITTCSSRCLVNANPSQQERHSHTIVAAFATNDGFLLGIRGGRQILGRDVQQGLHHDCYRDGESGDKRALQ